MLTQSERKYLLDSMKNLLDEYDYRYSNRALESIIDKWVSQKGWLIEAFKKHPNYIDGKFMIAFDADYERKVEIQASLEFKNWIIGHAMRAKAYIFPDAVKGDYYCGLRASVYDFFYCIQNFAERCISESTAAHLGQVFTELKFHANQKTSRVVNKICQYLGFDKVDGYNREFAKYADSLSPMVIKRHTILSINPLDYLTMSFGNSWASCHTIDKENKMRMPNSYSGCYSSGTISYMLDKVSMVLYTVDASYEGNEYWDEPKINRQMFHYGEEKLVQGRLYPQDNDGYNDIYAPYRNIVQEIIATIFEFPNLWTMSRGTESVCKYVSGNGTNYPDYRHYNSCTISRIKGSENENYITVGEKPICIYCGYTHWGEQSISCCGNGYECADCGCDIDEDDVIWINGDPYCSDCVHYCEYCEEYHRNNEYYVEDYGYVCEHCADRYFEYCEECGRYFREGSTHYIDCEDRNVCDGCLDDYYAQCEDCCEYFRNGDMHEYDGMTLCSDCYDERTEESEEAQ